MLKTKIGFNLWHAFAILIALRLLYLFPFCEVTDLAGDESYYWEWGRRPDWGYFSKPPMIGWLMGIVGWLSGHQEWAVRMASWLLGSVSLAILVTLTKRMFGNRAAWFCLLFTALTPANIALSLFFTIDAPLVLFWTLALFFFWEAVQTPKRSLSWGLLGFVLGLGYLSKQMMLVFPLLMLFVAILAGKSALLRNFRFWLCIGGSLSFMAPVIAWNNQHQWITLQHTGHHFAAPTPLFSMDWLKTAVSFPLAQAGLFTPITWGLLVTVLAAALWKWKTLDVQRRFLVLFSVPGLLVFCGLALRQNVNPNWPAVFYLGAMVLLAASAADWTAESLSWRGMGRWVTPAMVTAFVICAVVWMLPFVGTGGRSWDVVKRLRGWREAGQQAGHFLAGVPRPDQTFFLALGHRDNASQLAFYTPQHPRVYRWQADESIASQYELWPSASERIGQDALVFQPTEKPLPKSLSKVFASIEKQGVVDVPIGKGESRKWTVYLGKQLLYWPPVTKKQELAGNSVSAGQ